MTFKLSRIGSTFKIGGIENVGLLDEQYMVPEDFDANEYLGSSWGIVVDGEVKTIKLTFNSEIARIAEENRWGNVECL